ncbi:MAG: glutamine--tRNA ligase, partial [Bradymonadaceae bacterium]
PEAVRTFCEMIGIGKAENRADIGVLEYAIRDELNTVAPRVMCVLDPLKVVITNYPEGEVEERESPYFPTELAREGTRQVPFEREIYIEREDFMEEPPKKWYRLAPGKEVRLRYGYFIKCEEVIRDANGEVVELRCTYDPETSGGSAPDGRKVKGTLHWVSASRSLPAEVRLYDRLFAAEKPDAAPEGDFRTNLNPDSLIVFPNSRIEPSVAEDDTETRYQFERQGYFWRDPVDSTGSRLVFNRIVALRDSWDREQAKDETPKAAKEQPSKAPSPRERPNKKPASYERDLAREQNPVLARRLRRYEDDLGLPYDDADLLSGNEAVSDFFEAALQAYGSPQTLASAMVNDLLPLIDDDESILNLSVSPAQFGTLVQLVDDDKITSRVSRDVLTEMLESGRDPQDIVTEQGLEKVSDTS